MRLLATAAAVAAMVLLTAPAHAQFSMGGGGESQKTRYSEQEKRDEAANERAYRDAVRNTKGATNETYDPWRNIRPAEQQKKPQR